MIKRARGRHRRPLREELELLMRAKIARGTGLNEGEIALVLAELRDTAVYHNLSGRAVKLDGLGVYAPTVGLEGTIRCTHRMDSKIKRAMNAPGAFQGEIVNREHIGMSLEDLVDLWNEEHPDDPIQ